MRITDLDRQIANDHQHPCSKTMRRALDAERRLDALEQAGRGLNHYIGEAVQGGPMLRPGAGPDVERFRETLRGADD